MKRFAVTAALTTAIVIGTATSASAFFCTVADKPTGAGSGTFGDMKTNAAGRDVYPGAFINFGGGDVFVRGGVKVDPDKQFGFATIQAQCNGPADHGVIDPDGEVCD